MALRFVRDSLARMGVGVYSKRIGLGFGFLVRYQKLRSGSPFRFVQIGAQDGVTGDPIREWILGGGWSGVLVEPRRAPFEQLQRSYSGRRGLTLLNCAIGDSKETRTMYGLDPLDLTLPAWAHGLGTFELETLLRHEQEIPDLRKRIVSEAVACWTWNEVLAEARLPWLDLLQIDAEGMDFELIRTFPLELVRPGLIRYEHKHLCAADRAACEDLLVSAGYVPVVERQDTCAVAVDWRPLGSELDRPRSR